MSSKEEHNFATGLKALLRHDPDVILIGEIREATTAKLASEAALTGHVVLSSLTHQFCHWGYYSFKKLRSRKF